MNMKNLSESGDGQNDLPLVALIAGPTASGKSGLAVALAHHYKAAGKKAIVVNMDSAQVYADLSVLSARPTLHEMEGIRHRLYGYIDGSQACSAAKWAADAKAEIAAAHNEGAVPILVGGTGLYMRTLLDGISPIPEIDPAMRAEIRAMDTADAYAALQAEDPERAAILSPNDSNRISRALEVVRSSGRTLGEWQAVKEGGIGEDITLQPLVLLPPRDWLYERCDRRFGMMLDNGAVDEVRALLARDLADDCPVMRAIGVPEISAWLDGDIDRGQACENGQTATRQYAKRQYTWFRNQSPGEWPRWEGEINNNNIDRIITLFQY